MLESFSAEEQPKTAGRMATIGEIADFWEARQPPLLIAIPWADSCESCWRCGDKAELQRCHIIPESRGGSGDPENLLLLCARCHRDAPNVADPCFMLAWLEATADPDYWNEQAAQLFKRINGREPFSRLADGIDIDQQRAALKHASRLASTHHGDGWWNAATVCAMFALAEELLLAEIEAASAQRPLEMAAGPLTGLRHPSDCPPPPALHHPPMMTLLLLPCGAVLVVWPDGRALRVERDGSTRGAYSPQGARGAPRSP